MDSHIQYFIHLLTSCDTHDAHDMINILLEKFVQIEYIFDINKPIVIQWYELAGICKQMMDITMAIIKLDKTNILDEFSYNTLLSVWKALLVNINYSGAKICRIGEKSTLRHFPTCLKLINIAIEKNNINTLPTVTTLINNIRIKVIDGRKINEYSNIEINKFVENQDDFYNRVYGHSLGKRIIKIWTKSSSCINVYAENSMDHNIIGLTSCIFLTVNNKTYAFVNGLGVDPEMVGFNLGAQLVNKLYELILGQTNRTNLEGIIFGVQDGNEIMQQFMTKYQSNFPNLQNLSIMNIRGKSMFIKEDITMYYVNFLNNNNNNSIYLPTIDELDNALLEEGKIATRESNKSIATFYMLAAKMMVRQWFHSTTFGQFLQA